jgi:arylsulfatase
MRWPGKVQAGTSSNEIVHAMDLFPTFARIAGGEVPTDRVIDGVDQTDFLLGGQEKSNRDTVIVYMGEEIFAVKWRDWKLHFKEAESTFSDTREFETPHLYNLLVDPGERQNVLFPHTWVPRVALTKLEEHLASLKENPPIKLGQLDPYLPPSK